MKRLALGIAFLVFAANTGALYAREPGDRTALIREIVNRSRLLEDAYFRLPRSVWQRFVVDQAKGDAPAPVSCIRSQGIYRLKIDGKGSAGIEAEIHLLVLDARGGGPVAVLPDSLAWSEISLSVGDKDARATDFKPATVGRWLVYSPAEPGRHVIRARAELKGFKASGGTLTLPTIRTVQTAVTLDSPRAFEVTAAGAARMAAGSAEKGTHVALPLKPASKLVLNYRPARRRTARQAAYQVRGAVAWNFGPAARQVSADLRIAILGGKSDGLEITLPAAARRVAVSGPDVREVRTDRGAVSVFFRGSITGRTSLKLNYELPAAKGAADLGRPEIRNGRWSGGVLVITNTAGGSEIQPAAMPGLKEIALPDIPPAASAILAGKAVWAYEITSGQWSARAESINLGEFAIKQTLADSARYQFAYRPDGTVICRADYEIRNRNRQFLRITLPVGAKVLLARVSEKSRPMTPLPGQKGHYLLPLERSTASVMGLVSFPVQLVYMYRGDALKSSGRGAVALPQIDIPIAYAWCQAGMPGGMSRVKFSGIMKPVEQYSSQTALASMTYGSATALDPERKRLGKPEAKKKPSPDKGGGGGGVLGWLLGSRDARAKGEILADKGPAPMLDKPPTVKVPAGGTLVLGGQITSSSGSLYRNYWRTGKESYDRGRYDEANKALSKVLEMAPKSPDAANARRLLANIKLMKGKLQVKSRSEKAAAVAVKQQISASNVDELRRQRQLVEEGTKAAKQKDTKRAQALFRAAEALGKKLVARGESTVEQDARLREARQQLDLARKTSSEKLDQGLKQLKQLRKSKRIDEAVALGEKLAEDADELSDSGAAGITLELQKERIALAIESARTRLGASHAPLKELVSRQAAIDRLINQRTGLATQPATRPQGFGDQPFDGIQGGLVPGATGRRRQPGGGPGQAQREGEKGRYRFRLTSPHRIKQMADSIKNADKSRPTARPQGLGDQSINGVQITLDAPGPTIDAVQVYKVGDLVTALSDGDIDGDGNGALDDIAGNEAARDKRTSELTGQVRSLLRNGRVQVTTFEGQRALTVTGGAAEQEAVSTLIAGLRRARGPQVQIGSNLALQKAIGQTTDGGWSYRSGSRADARGIAPMNISGIASMYVTTDTMGVESTVAADRRHVTAGIPHRTFTFDGGTNAANVDPELQKFIDRNYAWQNRGGGGAASKKQMEDHHPGPGFVLSGLVQQHNVMRGEATMEYEKAMQRSRDLVAGANSGADFRAAVEAARAAGNAVETSKSLFGGDKYRQMQAAVARQIDWIGRNRDKWTKDRTAMERQQIQQAKMELIRQNEAPRGERVNKLTARAKSLSAEGKFGAALAELRQIRILDPKNRWANEQMELVQNYAQLESEKRPVKDVSQESHKSADVRRVEATLEYESAMRRSKKLVGSGDDHKSLSEAFKSAQAARHALALAASLSKSDKYAQMLEDAERHSRRIEEKLNKIRKEMMQCRISDTGPINQTGRGLSELLARTRRESYRSSVDVRRSEIPWNLLVTYPKDWKEVTTSRKPRDARRQAAMERDRAIRRELGTRVSKLDFEDMELSQVFQFLRDVSGMNIHVKWRALALESIEPATTVNVHLTNVTFRKALEAILEEVATGGKLGLDYVIDEGVITISTRRGLGSQTVIGIYDIRDIIARAPMFEGPWLSLSRGGGLAARAKAVGEITTRITKAVDRDSWRVAGGAGAISEIGGLLVITQSRRNHARALELIGRLRQARGLKGPSRWFRVVEADVQTQTEMDRITEKLLNQEVSKLDFEDMELDQVFQFLRDVSGANIHVKWRALALESIERATTVNVHLTGVTFRKTLETVLEDVATIGGRGVEAPGLGYVSNEGVITVSTKSDLGSQTVVRVYDIREMIDLCAGLEGSRKSHRKIVGEIRRLIMNTVNRSSWQDHGGQAGAISGKGGRLVITQSVGTHAKIVGLIGKIRRAGGLKGPAKWSQARKTRKQAETKADRIVRKQLDTRVSKLDFEDMELSQVFAFFRDVSGANIHVKWRALAREGIEPATTVNVHLTNVTFRKALEIVLDDVAGGGKSPLGHAVNDGIITVSTKSDLAGRPGARKVTKSKSVTAGGRLDAAELARKLRSNRWQKTQVSSLNLNVDSAAANSLGVKFHKGNNDVSFTVIDEAQFRTLMELDAARNATADGTRVGANETRQDTIVGTDALLANTMTTNVSYSRDTGNTLDIADNPINLAHEKYVLIDNNGYLTAVRAGEMQHWQEASKPIEFVKVPQEIEIPRVGELVKLEKTLVKPSDEMVVRFDYQGKGR